MRKIVFQWIHILFKGHKMDTIYSINYQRYFIYIYIEMYNKNKMFIKILRLGLCLDGGMEEYGGMVILGYSNPQANKLCVCVSVYSLR